MKATPIKTDITTYDIGSGFRLDIAIDEGTDGVECSGWLWHKDYSVKQFTIGMPMNQNGKQFTITEAVNLILNDLEMNGHIATYMEEYF